LDRSLTRRDWLGSALGVALAAAWRRDARALGRIPSTGKLALALPWPVATIDPHDQFDAAAALFGSSLFDQLFALEPSGDAYPTLAADAPVAQGAKTIVRLREGLVTAKGRKLDARDLAFSLDRARRGAALAWWGDLPLPSLVPKDPLALAFATTDGVRLARTLSSPFFALVPRGFDPKAPDGTGAMAAETSGTRLILRRNPNAARGGSFLDEVVVDQAPDLLASLRSFEGNVTDIGWLSSGLHAPRPGSAPFDLGSVAWIVLQTGSEAGPWGAPGIAQRLLDGLDPGRLQRFGLGPLPPASSLGAEWGGKPCELLVVEGSAYLEELARTLSSMLSRPSHEVTVKTVPGPELARRRASGAFSLMLGIARPLAGGPKAAPNNENAGAPSNANGAATLVSLAAAADPASGLEVMRRPPRLASFAPRLVTRTLKLGVLGELRVTGAHAPDVHLAKSPSGDGWDLASSYRAPPPT
jgi:peptide/nickel transport system substrate-binding protein